MGGYSTGIPEIDALQFRYLGTRVVHPKNIVKLCVVGVGRGVLFLDKSGIIYTSYNRDRVHRYHIDNLTVNSLIKLGVLKSDVIAKLAAKQIARDNSEAARSVLDNKETLKKLGFELTKDQLVLLDKLCVEGEE